MLPQFSTANVGNNRESNAFASKTPQMSIVRGDAMADFGLGLVMGGSIGLGIGLVLVIGLVYLLSERL